MGTVYTLEAYYMPIAMMQTLYKTSANSMQRTSSGYSAQASIIPAHCVLSIYSAQASSVQSHCNMYNTGKYALSIIYKN